MEADTRADEFRRKVDDEHLLLKTSVDQEERFIFDLRHGRLVLPQHPAQVRRLLDLAEEFYGFRMGEHAELLALAALREEVEDVSGASVEIVWRHVDASVLDAASPIWIDLDSWIEDQFLMEDALELLRGGEVG